MSSLAVRCCKSTPLWLALALPAWVGAQAPSEQGSPAAGIVVSSRYSARLELPSGGRVIGVLVELGSWRLEKAAQEIELPARGFYVAELMNGSAITVIAGRETLRKSGDLWAVRAGEPMRIKATAAEQQNVLLHIFSVRVGN